MEAEKTMIMIRATAGEKKILTAYSKKIGCTKSEAVRRWILTLAEKFPELSNEVETEGKSEE